MSVNGSIQTNTSGEFNVAFDYAQKGGSDCLSDKTMAEIVRRVKGFVESEITGDVIFDRNEPNDKHKLWVKLNNSGSIVGPIKRYDTTSGSWVDDHYVPSSLQALNRYYDGSTISSNDQSVTYPHSIGGVNYTVHVNLLSEPMTDSRWYITSQDNNSITIRYLDMLNVVIGLKVIEYST